MRGHYGRRSLHAHHSWLRGRSRACGHCGWRSTRAHHRGRRNTHAHRNWLGGRSRACGHCGWRSAHAHRGMPATTTASAAAREDGSRRHRQS
jgi:hypothetical protein